MSRGDSHETHRSHRTGWLRAGVLGANDGIVSTAALMVGIAGTAATRTEVVTAGIAGLVAGAGSMAVGEFVSVSSQRDSERADLEKERVELADFPDAELRELTEIYVKRGLRRELATQVAREMHAHDALGAHLRDELGLDRNALANPQQAAWTSAASFGVGAAVPVLIGLVGWTWLIVVIALASLAVLGAVSARLGGANQWVAATRIVATSGAAMAATYVIGKLIGAAV